MRSIKTIEENFLKVKTINTLVEVKGKNGETVLTSEVHGISHAITLFKKRNVLQDNPDKQKYKNDWYLKTEDDPYRVFLEVIALEVLRLLQPVTQPKARIVSDEDMNIYIATKGVNFIPLAIYLGAKKDAFTKDFETQHIENFGSMMAYLLFLNEIDAKLNDIGLIPLPEDKDKYHFVRLDCGCSFHRLLQEEGYFLTEAQVAAKRGSAKDTQPESQTERKLNHDQNNITKNTIKNLPFCVDYYAYNWFDDICQETINDSHLFNKNLINNDVFKQDVFQGILSIIMLSNRLIEHMIYYYAMHYIPNIFVGKSQEDIREMTDEVVNELIMRKQQFIDAMKDNQEFCSYLASKEARKHIVSRIEELNEFILLGKDKLLDRLVEGEENFNVELQRIEKEFNVKIFEEESPQQKKIKLESKKESAEDDQALTEFLRNTAPDFEGLLSVNAFNPTMSPSQGEKINYFSSPEASPFVDFASPQSIGNQFRLLSPPPFLPTSVPDQKAPENESEKSKANRGAISFLIN